MMHAPERYRYSGERIPDIFRSSAEDGNNGYFVIPFESYDLVVLASDGREWEHVSVSLRNRTPNWREMCYVKSLFWDPEDCVMQLHPPESEYVNNHEYCLHLWRPIGKEIPRPPSNMVGEK